MLSRSSVPSIVVLSRGLALLIGKGVKFITFYMFADKMFGERLLYICSVILSPYLKILISKVMIDRLLFILLVIFIEYILYADH